MNSEEDLICLQCKNNFSEENPPRMLTMCGHTFCDACIKSLILKKKTNNKYKLTCPEDKNSIDLTSANSSFFPKNIALLKIIETKSKNKEEKIKSNLSSIRLSSIEPIKIKSEESMLTIGIDEFPHHETSQPKSKQLGSNSIIFQLDDIQTDICLLHQKPLDIVCVRDCQRICPSCAIFGEHKSHQMKSLIEVEELKKKMEKTLKTLLAEKKKVTNRIHGKQLWNSVDKNLEKKKKEMNIQIKKKYKLLQEMVSKSEKKALAELEKKVGETEKKIKKLVQIEDEENQFVMWEEKAQQKLDILQGKSQEDKYKILLKPQDVILVGEKFIQTLKLKEQIFPIEAEKLLDKLTIGFSIERTNQILSQFCTIEEYENSFLAIEDVSNLGINVANSLEIKEEESLLEGGQCHFQKNLKSAENFMKMTLKNSQNSSHSQSTHKKGKGPPIRSPKSGLKVSSINNIASCRSLNSKGFQNYFKAKPKLKLGEKYQKSINNLINGNTDTLDLTNAELGDEKLDSVLQLVKEKGMTVAKLGRNKLTDEGFHKILPYLTNIIILNVSKNELTERCLEIILKSRKMGELPELKSVMIGQNKIPQRKNRSKLEEIKLLGINVCI